MKLAAERVAYWMIDLITAMVVVGLIVFILDRSIASDTFRWPALYGNFLVVIATFLVATITFRSQIVDGAQDAEVATSLFTFANSVAALIPLLVELFQSTPEAVSSKLSQSVVYEIFSERSAAETIVYVTVFCLIAVAFCFAWYAAGQIARRRGTAWFASTASVLILSVQLLLISPWNSAELKADPSTLLVFVLVLMVIYSGVVASIVQRIPVATRSAFTIVRAGLRTMLAEAWTFLRAAAFRAVWILLTIPVYLTFELVVVPAGLSAANVLSSAIYAVFRWIIAAFFLIASGCVIALVVGWTWAVIARLPAAYQLQTQPRKAALRNSLMLVIAIAIVLFFWPTKHDAPEPVFEDPVVVEEIILAERIEAHDVTVECNSEYFGFGWEYGSSSDLTMSIYACRPDEHESTLSKGAILILGTASTESPAAVNAENERAKDRGFALARLLLGQQVRIDEPASVYVLNLGMHLSGLSNLPREFQDAQTDRPTTLVKFSPYPEGAIANAQQIEEAIARYISRNYSSADHALCELYRVQGADAGEVELLSLDLCS